MIQTRSIHSTLRHATQASHEAVDAQFPEGLPSPASYRTYLHGMNAVVEGLASQRSQLDLRLLDSKLMAPFERLAQMQSALLDDAASDPLACDGPKLSRLSGYAEAIGAIYVVLGSSLGARYLLKQARASAVMVDLPLHFLEHLAQMSALWPAFCAALDAHPETDLPELTAGADAAFNCVQQNFLHASALTGTRN